MLQTLIEGIVQNLFFEKMHPYKCYLNIYDEDKVVELLQLQSDQWSLQKYEHYKEVRWNMAKVDV